MPVTGEITYEDFLVFIHQGPMALDLNIPQGGLMSLLGGLRTPALNLVVDDITVEGGEEFRTMLQENMESFRIFLAEKLPRRTAMAGILVFHGGAVRSSLGTVTFQGEFRRPTAEDYAALDKYLVEADRQQEELLLEHCKTCATCAAAEGLPIPEGVALDPENPQNVLYPWGWQHNDDDDEQVH